MLQTDNFFEEHQLVIDNQDTDSVDDLVDRLKPIIQDFKKLQAQAKSLGIFANHRDLAECNDCKLFEDITSYGVLFVYRGDNYYEDTGLKFIELDDNAVQCPECGKTFCSYKPL